MHNRKIYIFISCIVLIIIGLHVWASIVNIQKINHVIDDIKKLKNDELTSHKTRQEIISIQIENSLKSIIFNRFLSALGPIITAMVAISGVWIGLRNYLDTRKKERLDQAAVDLRGVLENLVSDEPRERAVGVVGLQHFLTADKEGYHLRALSALVTAVRIEEDKEVLRTIRIAIEQAVRNVSDEIIRQISWQSVKLNGVNFSGRVLSRIDLRDAFLEDADLSGCDLSLASLINARLNGANLSKSILQEAKLSYVDFAGASLVGANLQDASLYHAKVLKMDIQDADLRGVEFHPEDVPWTYIKNWRKATFDPGLLDQLIRRYGPSARGRRILMLMWEIPPLVAGGTWTACYHLVRNLRKQGADVTVVVPWDISSIISNPFGCEVDVIPLGIVPPKPMPNSYQQIWSPYPSWSSYSSSGFSSAQWSPYDSTFRYSPYPFFYAPYATLYSVYHQMNRFIGVEPGSTLLRLVDDFRKRLLRMDHLNAFDMIHSHDWVTFEAAEVVARRIKRPWIAHFHSTERERRLKGHDIILERIERQGASHADRIVAPGQRTAKIIQKYYEIPEEKIKVIPNVLSEMSIDPLEMGSFESKRIIFFGRLTKQKGPDLFVELAEAFTHESSSASFWIYGDGEERYGLRYPRNLHLQGWVDWANRGSVFKDASAVVVPSRAEPFGMVVLEAMQHHVPVLYPRSSGAAEVLDAGIKINPRNIASVVKVLHRLLTNWQFWEEIVNKQAEIVEAFYAQEYESAILHLWESMIPAEERL